MCIISSYIVLFVDASNPIVELRVLALIADFLEILQKVSPGFIHLACVGLTSTSNKWYPMKSKLCLGISSDIS